MLTPKDIFLKEYGESKNFMTPDVIRYGWIIDNKIAYELSNGRGFDNKSIYGVTIVSITPDGATLRHDNKELTPTSEMFFNRDNAEYYIKESRKEARKEGANNE